MRTSRSWRQGLQTPARWWRRAVARFTRSRLDDEMQEEIREHLERRRQQLIADGVDPARAEAEARRAFGNVMKVREQLHDGWGFPQLESLMQDVRYGARLLRRAPGFTAVAILSLSVGLGAAAVVFNVADAVLFRPLTVRDPGALRSFRAEIGMGLGVRKIVFGADPGEIEAMRRETGFADLAAFRTVDGIVWKPAAGESHELRAEFVSPEYFEVLGVPPAAGRLLDTSDRGLSPIPIVISDRLWRASLDADASAVGRNASVNGIPATIVGVASSFRGLTAERPADLFMPIDTTAHVEPAAMSVLARMVLRLRNGVSAAEAEQKMAATYKSLGPPMAKASEVRVLLPDASRGVSDARDDLRWPIGLGLLLVAVLMMVACANTGGLLVARFAARRTEFGVRIAIGAGHARLLRQLAVEAMLLAAIAGGAALLVARVAAPMLAAAVPGDASLAFDVRFDCRIVLFTFVAALVAAAGAAAMSLRQLLHTDTASVLSAGSRSLAGGRRSSLEFLVGSQVGCSVLLLIVSIGMGRTLMNLRHVDAGFDPAGVLSITVNASGRNAPSSTMPAYFNGIYERVKALPQVERVSMSQIGLLTRGMTTGTVEIPGRTAGTADEEWVRLFFVGPDFFETAGMRMIAGDSLGAPEMTGHQRVAVVTRQFADFYFGNAQNALGRLVNRDVRIIGVVADGRYNTFRDGPVRAMFLPFTKAPVRSTMTFIVRAAGDQQQAIAAVAGVIRSYDPVLRVTAVPMAALVDATMGRERFAGSIAATLTLLALILSCAGVYATVAFSVAERRKELAVRFALGATTRDVARLVIRGPVRVAAAGIAVALPCAYVLMRAASNLLYGVPAFDPITVLASVVGLLTISAIAAAVPAWRTRSIDPQECLRAN